MPNSDFSFIKASYFLKNNRRLNIENPQELCEKLHWLRFNAFDESYKNFVDKYEVRDFVKNTIGEQYLVGLIGVYDRVDEIDINKLPQQFVLKGTHGSGYNIIVKDKGKFDWPKAQKKLKKFLASNYYYKYKEPLYKNIKPRIIAEVYLEQGNNQNIIDYKIYCFHGVPKSIWVKTYHDNRYKFCFYDLDWHKIKEAKPRANYLDIDLPKPENLDELINIAKKLSEQFIFIRVDLYSIANKVYFGELTFAPNAGLKREEAEPLNAVFGSFIKLPI